MPTDKSDPLTWLQDRKCALLEQEKLRLSKYNDPKTLRENVLPSTQLAYLEMLEVGGGRLDMAAAAIHYIVMAENTRLSKRKPHADTPPSVQGQPALWAEAKRRLSEGHGTPLALVRAAFVFVGGAPDDSANCQWLWVAEKLLFTAVSQTATGGSDEATCRFAIGWLYANASSPNAPSADTRVHLLILSTRFLEQARKAADSHRHDWTLATDVQEALGLPPLHDHGLWTAACFAVHDVFIRYSRAGLDPNQSLRAAQYARGLAELCGLKGVRRAVVAYELGVRHRAVGQFDRATEAFGECVAVATALDAADADTDLDLDARLQVALMSLPPTPDDSVLERIADEATRRNCRRVRLKAIMARGRVAADDGQADRAYGHFALAQRLAEETGDGEELDAARVYAATAQTCAFMQTNFRWLCDTGFNLLAEPHAWNGRPTVYRYETDDGGPAVSDDSRTYSSGADSVPDTGVAYNGYFPGDLQYPADGYPPGQDRQYADYLPIQTAARPIDNHQAARPRHELTQTSVDLPKPAKQKVTFDGNQNTAPLAQASNMSNER